jgi:O-antigen/teichoic acid export membrane protein
MPIMAFLYPEIAVESASVFLILMPCLIPFSMTYIFGTLLTANGNLRVLNITSAIAIIVNVLINFTLIPLLEARGAAIAALAAQTSIMIMQFILAFKLLKIPYSSIPFFRCGLFTCLLIIATYTATLYLPFGLIVNLAICSVAALGLAFATRLVNLGFIGELFMRKVR